MRRQTKRARAAACVMVLASILLSGAAAEAMAATEVRLLHAIPGGANAQLELSGGGAPSNPVGFGQATEYLSSESTNVTATVVVDGEPLGEPAEVVEGARYTLVAHRDGATETITGFAEGEPTPGKTRWRMVHVAPEIDTAEMLLDDRVVDRLSLGEAGEYRTEEPRAASLSVRRPGEDLALAENGEAALVAGTAQTAYLVGSGGEPTRFVVLQDAASAPEEAPDTGRGGLHPGEGGPWLTALLAAVAAGAAGGLLFARRARG